MTYVASPQVKTGKQEKNRERTNYGRRSGGRWKIWTPASPIRLCLDKGKLATGHAAAEAIPGMHQRLTFFMT